MSESTLASSVALIGTTVLVLVLVAVLFQLTSSRVAALAMVISLIFAGTGAVYFVDVNVPLMQSHFRPSGEPAPVWMALLAWGARVAALFSLIHFGRWSKFGRTHA